MTRATTIGQSLTRPEIGCRLALQQLANTFSTIAISSCNFRAFSFAPIVGAWTIHPSLFLCVWRVLLIVVVPASVTCTRCRPFPRAHTIDTYHLLPGCSSCRADESTLASTCQLHIYGQRNWSKNRGCRAVKISRTTCCSQNSPKCTQTTAWCKHHKHRQLR
jgi:hypothetical protein